MGKPGFRGDLERVSDCCWRIPRSYKKGMRVDGLIFADDRLISQIRDDQAPEQVANVAFLPGIQGQLFQQFALISPVLFYALLSLAGRRCRRVGCLDSRSSGYLGRSA